MFLDYYLKQNVKEDFVPLFLEHAESIGPGHKTFANAIVHDNNVILNYVKNGFVSLDNNDIYIIDLVSIFTKMTPINVMSQINEKGANFFDDIGNFALFEQILERKLRVNSVKLSLVNLSNKLSYNFPIEMNQDMFYKISYNKDKLKGQNMNRFEFDSYFIARKLYQRHKESELEDSKYHGFEFDY